MAVELAGVLRGLVLLAERDRPAVATLRGGLTVSVGRRGGIWILLAEREPTGPGEVEMRELEKRWPLAQVVMERGRNGVKAWVKFETPTQGNSLHPNPPPEYREREWSRDDTDITAA